MKRVSWSRILNVGGLTLALAGLLVSIFFVFREDIPYRTRAPTPAELAAYVTAGIETNKMINELASLRAELDALSDTPQDVPVRATLQRVQGRLNAIDSRVEAFERVVSDGPLKALETAMLRKDVNDMETDLTLYQVNNSRELDRIYGQNNVFIGLIVTTLLSLIGFIVSTFVKRPSN